VETIYEKRTADQSTWTGRQRKGFRCVNSFQEFVDKAVQTKEGQAHLERHHGGKTAARGGRA
jgi:hypothetical protein